MAVSKYISKIGVENEGGFLLLPGFRGEIIAKENINIVKDTSVKLNSRMLQRYVGGKTKYNYDLGTLMTYYRSGEVVSRPMDSIDEGANYIRKYWPDFVNASCGFHVHLSFNDISYYSCLMEESFNNYYKETLREFSEKEKLNRTFKSRFEGRNDYCRDAFLPNEQAFRSGKYTSNRATNPRYAALNFCWSLHGTMECRVFSANMGVNKAVLGYLWFVKMVDNYLAMNYDSFIKREHSKEIEIEYEEEGIIIDLARKPNIKLPPPKESAEEAIDYMVDNFDKFYSKLTKLSESKKTETKELKTFTFNEKGLLEDWTLTEPPFNVVTLDNVTLNQ